MRKRNSLGFLGFAVLLLGIVLVCMLHFFWENPVYYQLNEYTSEEESFRAMAFGEGNLSAMFSMAEEKKEDPFEVIAAFMVDSEYDLTEGTGKSLSFGRWQDIKKGVNRVKPVEFTKLSHAYETLLTDLKYFPLPQGDSEASRNYGYEDSWGYERTYGGERRHEGTDIMGGGNSRGFFPVISVSDGTIEHIGWLELGGWRIGIRTPHGAYLYYAHLSSYDHEFVPGEEIKAGQLLGFMGDTGYSKVEGTTGNFAVHLHFGIYFRTDHYEELSVNPYWILKYLEDKKVKYSY